MSTSAVTALAAEVATAIPGVVPAVTSTNSSATPAPVQPANPAPEVAAVPPRGDADGILARIVAGITIPAAELGVPPVPGREPAPAAASLEAAAARAERNPAVAERRQRPGAQEATARVEAVVKATERTQLAKTDARPGAGNRRGEQVEEDDAPRTGNSRGASAKEDDDAPGGRSRRGASAKDDDAPADRKRRGKGEAEPARIWVQVAGGANEGDLPKAWAAARAKAPALAGRAAYATPLRATNRVVTGPFKTEAEARAMVNTLAKQGLSAFTFTSDAGQKMTRLDGRAK